MPPVIDSVTLSRTSVSGSPGEVVRMTVEASSPEGRPLTIQVYPIDFVGGVFIPMSETEFDWILPEGRP